MKMRLFILAISMTFLLTWNLANHARAGKMVVSNVPGEPILNTNSAILGYTTDITPTSFTAYLPLISRSASPGSLVTSFGTDGKVIDYFDGFIAAIAVQPDGKLVATGGGSLTRYYSNGSLDTTFGTAGKVDPPAGMGGAKAIKIETDGKIVIAGNYTEEIGQPYPRRQVALARYLANGSIDTTFGLNGIVRTSAGTDAAANALVIQADGKLVVAGSTKSSDTAWEHFLLIRYNPDGSLDTSFGTGGIAINLISSSYDWANALNIDANGKLVALGFAYTSSAGDCFAVVRYGSNGTLDYSFGGSGIVKVCTAGESRGNALAIQADGKLVLAGDVRHDYTRDFGLVRLNSDGTLDTSFGVGGGVITSVKDYDYPYALAIQPDGKLVVAGGAEDTGIFDFALARYNSNGSLDASFGTGGIVTTHIWSGFAYSLVILPDGKLVAGGGDSSRVLVCYWP